MIDFSLFIPTILNHSFMFAVIYTFKVKPEKDLKFIQGWKGLTELIYKHEGSRGSRLHKIEDSHYLAYAYWPDKKTWENSGEKLPKEADQHRDLMRESCESIETKFELDVVEDLLQPNVFDS